jgi:hypothetical protein
MASKKQHAAIDFQGAANITIGGSAGADGQVLTSGGSGAMSWAAKTSGGVSKVTFHLGWGYESVGSGSGSWRDNGTDGKIELMHGSESASSYWATGDSNDDVMIRFTHDLSTKYVATSILDVGGKIGESANEYLDLGLEDDVIARYIGQDVIELIIDVNINTIATGDVFEITFIG